ncbi:MAG: hypothetical protein ACYCYO_02175 [Bacilli bacterium]
MITDEMLIDRGFQYVSQVGLVQSAVILLLATDESWDVKEWARGVLAGVPANVLNAQAQGNEESAYGE